MPNPMVAMMGVTAGTSIIGARTQANAAETASDAQTQAAQLNVDEQRRQFDAIQQLYKPYIGAGSQALGGLMDLNGMNGNQAQRGAIGDIRDSAQFGMLQRAGFNAINQNASATGGLRGGNNQAALAQFAPNLLQGLIQQQVSNLGGMASMGQASAANQAAAGQNFANNAGQAFTQMGAAQAGNAIAQGQATSQMFGGIGGALNYGFGQAMQPAQIAGQGGGMVANPAAMPGSMFGKWGF